MTTNTPKVSEVGRMDAMGIDVGFCTTKYTVGRQESSNAIIVDQFPSHAELLAGGMQQLPMGSRLDGVCINVEDVPYFVGKDVLSVVRGNATKAVTSDYSATTAYKALFLGALSYAVTHAGVTSRLTIEHLVLGLPVSATRERREALREMTEGAHTIPVHGLEHPVNVVIQNVTVVAQPQGALVAIAGSRLVAKDTILVLDMGGGTFDWFVSEGLKPNHQRCGSVSIGMLDCATAVCDQIQRGLSDDSRILSKVDEALRLCSPSVRISGRDHHLSRHMPTVLKILESALESMLKSVTSLKNIDAIILTGGGAPMLAKTVATRMRDYTHIIHLDLEPVTSNARGFHMIAEVL